MVLATFLNITSTDILVTEENIWAKEGRSEKRRRKLHKEELYNLHSSPDIVRMMKWRRMRPLGRPMHRWEDNIKMDLKEMGWEGVDLIHVLIIGRVVDSC
jgi:hypothetical protein